MILFIGPYPNSVNEKDGMVQRVAFIDSIFQGRNRIFVDISFLGHFHLSMFNPAKGLKVYKLNFFLHFLFILLMGLRANFVYVHSIHYAVLVLPLYFFKKVVTDLHGVVPEELAYQEKKIWAKIMGIVEAFVIRQSWAVVTVTKALAVHLRKKYRRVPAIFTIPFLLKRNVRERKVDKTNPLTIIYSGGIQKWQNLDEMFRIIKILKNKFNYIILTGNPQVFTEKQAAWGLINQIKIKTVPYQKVFNYYRRAHLGFLLRQDHLVNRVSCPTKLMEYLCCGVVPILLQPEIGDFNKLGYAYILIDELLDGKLPTAETLSAMRQNNYQVVAELNRDCLKAAAELINFLS